MAHAHVKILYVESTFAAKLQQTEYAAYHY